MPELEGIHIVEHPLVQVRLATLRDRTTPVEGFRRALAELASLLAFEATRSLPTEPCTVQTPLAPCRAARLAAPIVVVPILRAGLGMAEALLKILPEARVGHVGLARDEQTFQPERYYFKTPSGLENCFVFLVDPMLATGRSACQAASALKRRGARRLALLCVVGCPEGARRFREEHPDVPIYLAALDEGLNDHAYIVPGLGDAGDRYFGT